MGQPLSRSRRYWILFTLMLTGEGIFLLPFVVARVFRPTFLSVFELTNFELGTAFSLYGVVAMVSYFFGGPIADRFPPRTIMIVSLLATAVAGLIMATIPSMVVLTLLYGFWGLSTILLYWAAAIKATRQYGGEESQGRSYGLVDGGRGLVAAAIASAAVLLLELLLPVPAEAATVGDLTQALSWIIGIFSGFVALTALLVWWTFPPHDKSATVASPKVGWDGLRTLRYHPSVWWQALILLCAYVGYKCTDDFSLYAQVAFGYDDVAAAHVGTISYWMRPGAAVAAGYLGDRFGHTRLTMIAFGIIIAGSTVIAAGVLEAALPVTLLMTIALASIGIYALRGLYFSLFQVSHFPLRFTGTAVGIISVIGYSPDVFFGPLMGYLLDHYPGAWGHQLLFLVLIGFALLGIVATWAFRQTVAKTQT